MLISKDQLLRIHDCTSVTNQAEIEEWFPELLRPNVEVGKWYKRQNNDNWKICISRINFEQRRVKTHGFNSVKDYVKREWSFQELHSLIECKTSEVHMALLGEAIIKGFVEGCHHTITNTLGVIKSRGDNYGYIAEDNKLLFNNYSIFEKGVWAKVLPEMTLEEAEKKFQCKITLNK